MGKSVLDKEKREKKSKKEAKPGKSGGKGNQEVGGDGGVGAVVEKVEQSGKEESKKAGKKAPHKGVKRVLRKAVKRAVKGHSNEIAESLVSHTVEGDLRSTEMVMTLMERKQKEGEEEKPWTGPSIADLLASEPEWDEETEAKQKAGALVTKPPTASC